MIDTAFADLLAAHVSLPGVTIALTQLPQDSSYPALVYQPVSDVPPTRLCQPATGGQGRVQVTALAHGAGAVNALLQQLRGQLEHHGPRSAGGSHILGCVFAGYGPPDFDNATGISSKSADYLISYR